MLLSTLLLSLVLCVSAADDNGTQTLQEHADADVKYSGIQEHDNLKGSEKLKVNINKTSGNIKQAAVTANNYDELCNIIKNNTQSSLVINLKSKTNYTVTKELVIDSSIKASSIIINGNSAVLDAKNKSIFMNISYAKTVTINNLTLKNTNYQKLSTISNNGTLTLKNCNFTDNSIKQNGFIFNRGTLNMDACNVKSTISNLEEFILDYPSAKGLIINYGSTYMTNSNISNIGASSASLVDNYAYLNLNKNVINNSVSDFGSIVSHIYSIAVIEKNTFTNCISTYAGVISNHGVITISNNRFTSNRASMAGVLYNNGNATFTSNILKSNEASIGGVIYNEYFNDTKTGDVYGFINCRNNSFISNNASVGAILSNHASIIFANNNVTNNFALDTVRFESENKTSGTAVIDNNAYMEIYNNSFDSNYALKTGLLYNGGNVSFVNNTVKNNYVLDNKSFVIENYGLINITKSYFSNNTDNYRDMLIYTSNNKYNISNNTYINNRLNNTIKISIKNNTITAQIILRNIYNSSVFNGSIYLYSNGRLNNNASVKNNVGVVDVLTRNVFKTTNNMTINYVSLDKHYLNTTLNFKYNSNFTSYITINNIKTVTAGDLLNVTANIVDKNNKPINEGYVIFKYNSLTIKDKNSQTLKINVSKGKVNLSYPIQNNTKTSTATIEVIYSGSGDKYEESRMMTTFNIVNRATLVASLNQSTVKMDQQIKFIATVKRDSKPINHGFVIFKINGVTVKDSKGNTVKAYLKNGVATHDFTIPDGWSAKTNKLTAVYSELTYTRLENKTYFSINKTQMHFNLSNVAGQKNKTVMIKGSLLDEYNHTVRGDSATIIKIDGVTYLKNDGKVQFYVVNNGEVIIKFIVPPALSTGNHTIEVVTGTRNAYIGTRTQLTLTVK